MTDPLVILLGVFLVVIGVVIAAWVAVNVAEPLGIIIFGVVLIGASPRWNE